MLIKSHCVVQEGKPAVANDHVIDAVDFRDKYL